MVPPCGTFFKKCMSKQSVLTSYLQNPDSNYFCDVYLNVKINDKNDNSPTFEGLNSNGEYPAAVTEETTVGEYVFSVIAIDLDGTSPNNLVKYYFPAVCGDCHAFSLDNDTGKISAAQTFDRSQQDLYRLSVVAYDGAEGVFPPAPNEGKCTSTS